MATLPQTSPLTRYGALTPSRMLFLALSLSLLPAELFTALAIILYIYYVIQTSKIANTLAMKVYLPFVIMATYAIITAGHNDGYALLKDGWYAPKLCLCLGLGCLIGFSEVNSAAGLRALIAFSIISGILVIVSWMFLGTRPETIGEAEAGVRLPLVAVAAIPVLLERIKAARQKLLFLPIGQLFVILLAVLVSDSRITILSAGVMIIAWTGSLANTRKAVVGILVTVAIGAAIWQLLPDYNGGQLTVATKLKRSLDEVLLTDGFDPTQMLLNWRGFEAYNAQLMFDQADLGQKIFGHGLGAVVDLGVSVDIGVDEPLRYLPILHNGYYNILIKYGLIGVVTYVFAVGRLAFMGVTVFGRGLLEDRMLRGMVIVILLSTAVITGLYNKSVLHSTTIFVGWLIGLLRHYQIAGGDVSTQPQRSASLAAPRPSAIQ